MDSLLLPEPNIFQDRILNLFQALSINGTGIQLNPTIKLVQCHNLLYIFDDAQCALS